MIEETLDDNLIDDYMRLKGRYFHSFEDDGVVKWQGYVLGSPGLGYYMVQLFEWLVGSPSCQKLVHLSEMNGWHFYDTQEEMAETYTYKLKHITGLQEPKKFEMLSPDEL